MRDKRYAIKLFVAALFLLLSHSALLAADSFRVIVSIKPIHSIVAGLMEGTEGPELLIGDAQTPYDFKLSDQQSEHLRQADLLIWVGPELEASLEQPIKRLPPQVQVLELLASSTMKILPSRIDDNRRAPFFWLDDRNVIILLNELALLLQESDPARAHIYSRNRLRLMQRLARIDREYEYGYRGLKAGLGVQYYDTLQYFEQAYALTVLNYVAESPRHEVDATSLLRVRERIRSGDAVCLLTEKGMPMQHFSLLTQGQDVNLGELDSLGTELKAGPDLYFQLMQQNTDRIKKCLNADMLEAKHARVLADMDDTPVVDGIGGGRFMLTDQLGRLVNEETMRGKYQLLYFGYTYCPDICPNTLQIVSMALDLLGDKANQIQPYFITVDPERDTVKILREYVEYFDPRMIGVTGSKPMIDNMAAQYRVKYEKVEEENSDPELYLMDHSASLYLLAPDGRFITKYVYGISAEKLAQELDRIIP